VRELDNIHRFVVVILTGLPLAVSGQIKSLSVESAHCVSNSVTNRGGGVELPYPILFVHGLVGNAGTWSEMSGWLSSAVGDAVDLEFCLNGDGYLNLSNLEDDLVSFMPANLPNANLYVLNFNCTPDGVCGSSTGVSVSGSSNQSGIYKQG
jgi:pimeloyl-ACP methyl ester carboxylesterase